MDTVGKKLDDGKRKWHLLPWGAVAVAVDVLDFGAEKYGEENWRLVQNFRSRYFSALMRHLIAWQQGEVVDEESGLPHLAHALCCLLFLFAKDNKF